MSTYDEALRAQNIVTDSIMEGRRGRRVVSVGIGKKGESHYVGVTATKAVKLPPLPPDLQHVEVEVQLVSDAARAY